MSSLPSHDQGADELNPKVAQPVPTTGRRVLQLPPRPRYTLSSSNVSLPVLNANEPSSSAPTSDIPAQGFNRRTEPTDRKARRQAGYQVTPEHFLRLAMVSLILRRDSTDPTATNPWTEMDIDLLHGVIPFVKRSDVGDIVWRYGDQIKVAHDRIVSDAAARGQTIPDMFRPLADPETMEMIDTLYAQH